MRGRVVLYFLFFVVGLTFFSGCTRCGEREVEYGERRPSREDFIRYNRTLFWRDSVCIARYSDSLGLNTSPTATNLWITEREEGRGELLTTGEKVSYEYVVTNLLGDTIYTSAEEGVRTLTVGRGEDTEALDEAMLMMRRGGSATVIGIPEKGFGVKGDDKRVRGRCILRYDIKIVE